MTAVTLLRRTRGEPDAQGNDTFTTTEVPVTGAVVWPSERTEQTSGGDVVTTLLTLSLPAGTTVQPVDAFRIDGALYEADGEAFVWTSPFNGYTPGVALHVRKVTG